MIPALELPVQRKGSVRRMLVLRSRVQCSGLENGMIARSCCYLLFSRIPQSTSGLILCVAMMYTVVDGSPDTGGVPNRHYGDASGKRSSRSACYEAACLLDPAGRQRPTGVPGR